MILFVEEGEHVGVKSLVLKQSSSYESMQPKKSYIDRPLPSQTRLLPTLDKAKDDMDDKGWHFLQQKCFTIYRLKM